MIAIDLGSNSCRFLHFDCKSGKKLGEFEALVKSADGLHVSGKISIKAQERVIKAIQDAKKHLDFTNQEILAYTTEAMRQASNSTEVLKEIERQTKVKFEIIDAKREAIYTLDAVRYRLKAMKREIKSLILIDIGGGSTELTFLYGEEIFSKSFKIGIVTVAQQCQTLQEVKSHLKVLFKEAEQYVEAIYKEYQKPQLFVATAGTPTTISAYLLGMNYKTYDSDKINGYTLTCKGIQRALNELMDMSEMKRAEYVGVGRESLIGSGIVIVQSFYRLLGFSSAVVVDDGLREGIALSYCKS
jgi:exopolyphosphatase/guanosine-5'-triphosphate,3'-diphosphate pyrophosphatase